MREGKVRISGYPKHRANALERAHNVHLFTALQSEYSLWSRQISALSTCEQLGIG
ncbi:hypothetical protein KCP78_24810 [Salmonella enterica subsp. enterica]|nr:hypothetical protein KCP78_24810 [Salmonella enterica subsp. enterica]